MVKKSIQFLIVMFLCLFFITPAMAVLTISNLEQFNIGNKRGTICDIAFDSSYGYGGESLTGVSVGMDAIHRVIVEGKDGYTFEYDHTNYKLKAMSDAPAIVWEEEHTSSDNDVAFYLDYPAAYVVAVVNTGGTAYPLTYSGTTNIASNKSTLPNGIEDDVRTGVSVASTTGDFVVTYVTQAWQDIYKLLVQNELLTGTGITRYTISGNTIFGWMCGKFDGDTSNLQVIEYSDTAAADEIGVDFGDNVALGNSGITQASCKISTGAKQVYATYLKHPGDDSWIVDRYVRDEDATSGTSVHSLDQPLLLWLQGQYVTLTGDPPHVIVLEDQPKYYFHNKNVTLAGSGASEINTRWGYRGGAADAAALDDSQVWTSLDEANATDVTHATYLYGHPWEIPNLKPLEAKNGSDLSDLSSVKVLIIGY